MPRKQHNTCKEQEVQVTAGEEFEWITTAEYCDIHILEDHPLDLDDYHVVKGQPHPAKAIGQKGSYKFNCKCSDDDITPTTNPKIIIS